MENTSNKKILTVSFMSAGIVVGVILKILMGAVSAVSGYAANIFSRDVVAHGLPVAVGLGMFLYCQFNSKILVWADEVISEIKRVVWPSRRDTIAMTIAVIIMILFSAVVLALIDTGSSKLIKWLIELPPLMG